MIDFVSWLYRWQMLAAGLVGGVLALIAAGVAYRGAVDAARRQIAAMRQAADHQAAAIQKQLADTQAARRQAEERKRSVIEWVVRAERRRLEAAIWALSPTGGGALPSGPQPASRRREQLLIESSALLRGEREDISLLDDRRRALLEDVAAAIDEYNSRIETAVDPSGDTPLIVQATLDAFGSLKELVGDLVASPAQAPAATVDMPGPVITRRLPGEATAEPAPSPQPPFEPQVSRPARRAKGGRAPAGAAAERGQPGSRPRANGRLGYTKQGNRLTEDSRYPWWGYPPDSWVPK